MASATDNRVKDAIDLVQRSATPFLDDFSELERILPPDQKATALAHFGIGSTKSAFSTLDAGVTMLSKLATQCATSLAAITADLGALSLYMKAKTPALSVPELKQQLVTVYQHVDITTTAVMSFGNDRYAPAAKYWGNGLGPTLDRQFGRTKSLAAGVCLPR